MVEAPRDLTRDFNMRHLVLAHRHEVWLVEQDVGALQQRIPQEPVRGQVPVLQLLLLVLVRRDALQPPKGRDHRQQQVQFRMLGHPGLDENGRDGGVQAGGEPVDGHLPHKGLEPRRILVTRREGVDVRDEEVALVLILQLGPRLERAMVVAEMQFARGPHTGQDASVGGRCRTQDLPSKKYGHSRWLLTSVLLISIC